MRDCSKDSPQLRKVSRLWVILQLRKVSAAQSLPTLSNFQTNHYIWINKNCERRFCNSRSRKNTFYNLHGCRLDWYFPATQSLPTLSNFQANTRCCGFLIRELPTKIKTRCCKVSRLWVISKLTPDVADLQSVTFQ